jgi:hypothetical protein
MLRNLRTQRFLGTPFRGIKGKYIPGSGDHGASVIYNDIDPVAEAEDEFRFRLTSAPTGFFMYEDGSFIFAPPADGSYTATGVLMKNGADVGPETITLTSGAPGVTISCSAGVAVSSGVSAAVLLGRTIACSAANATASGARASIVQTIGAGGTIPDASTISPARKVVFQGGHRVVAFQGGAHVVVFGSELA